MRLLSNACWTCLGEKEIHVKLTNVLSMHTSKHNDFGNSNNLPLWMRNGMDARTDNAGTSPSLGTQAETETTKEHSLQTLGKANGQDWRGATSLRHSLCKARGIMYHSLGLWFSSMNKRPPGLNNPEIMEFGGLGSSHNKTKTLFDQS